MFGFVIVAVLLFVQGHCLFEERLYVKPFPRNTLLTNFDFNVRSEAKSLEYYEGRRSDTIEVGKSAIGDIGDGKSDVDIGTSFYDFPRSLGPILTTTNTRELHLRFTQGWWDSDSWGAVFANGTRSGGTGVEVSAVVEARNRTEAVRNWVRLADTLSGMFCASFNFIDESVTTFPNDNKVSYTAEPENRVYLMRAALPSEPICTENLTPFLKLLPTRGKAGISSLLSGHKVYDALWHAMAIDIVTECDEETNKCGLSMDQSITAVIDVMRAFRRQEDGAIPRPIPGDKLRCDTTKEHNVWLCFPLGLPQEISYSLETIFGTPIKGSAFSGHVTPVVVDCDDNWSVLVDDGDSITTIENQFNLQQQKNINLQFDTKNSSSVAITPAPITVSRSLTGYSQDHGGFRVSFNNNNPYEVQVIYFESLPWFVRLYLHTMTATIKPENQDYHPVNLGDYVNLTHYQPAIDRKRPSHMELSINLAPKSRLTLDYKFEKSLLLYSEYPPDANHGFSVDPAVVSIVGHNYSLRTTSSLITLPTPDFSMPYNVIILTCTVMSLAFGSIFNLLVKDVITEKEFELGKKGLGKRIKEVIGGVKRSKSKGGEK